MAADVNVAMIIRTCEQALAAGYGDMNAAMCDWYVRPCGECGSAAPSAWCVPPEVTAPTLAAEVLGALRQSGAPTAPATPLIEKILRAHYPCAAQDGPRD
jgi:Rap1a immunity proteins